MDDEALLMDEFFTRIASRAASYLGAPLAFIISTLLILLWAASGPALHYSDTWQLIVNTATTVLTFLAVFLIQNSQNRDGAAIQAKLDEILRALDKARTEFVGIEHLTDAQICEIRTRLEQEVAASSDSRTASTEHTVEQLADRV
jgi:low affinity Fe/Cu permease